MPPLVLSDHQENQVIKDVTLDTNPIETEIATENMIVGENEETSGENHQTNGRYPFPPRSTWGITSR